MKTTFSFILFVISLFTELSVLGQIDSIDLTKVHDRKVSRIISSNQHTDGSLSACYNSADSADYQFHSASFIVDEPVDIVWKRYTNAQLEEAWNNRKMKLRCLVTKSNSKAVYSGESYRGLESGQLVFIKLRLVGGLLRLGVGFEIKDINEPDRTISYCYMQNGNSEGTQKIHFIPLTYGTTQIIHSSYYKSDSKFRDQKLYPFYHQRAIMALHASFNHMSLWRFRQSCKM